MDVFSLREQVVGEYAEYVRSFIRIEDPRIDEVVQREFRGGILWPEALVQLNPAFEPGGWVSDLVAQGVLHPEAEQIFRVGKADGPGRPLRLHRHQVEAIHAARTGDSYVLTTGTGSGKSLAYLIPIVDHVLRVGSGGGIQAIVVYPMNALANSQFQELEKFLCRGYPEGQPPVRFGLYTGQEDQATRDQLRQNPPDILLTNYVMLELILTRPRERELVESAAGLRFLVLDELHTYRGRQGSDVAMLVRRVRSACRAPDLQCVGTSATLASEGSFEDQRREVARVASLLFGTEVKPERVIGETLRRITPPAELQDPAFRDRLRKRIEGPPGVPPATYEEFVADPLASWIESTFGLREVEGRLERVPPRPVGGEGGAAQELADLVGLDPDRCREAIQEMLLAGFRLQDPETGFPVFAFRLHQFLSKGDTVYASPEPEPSRHITLQGQQFVPGDRGRRLLPLVFCRECGREYYAVWRLPADESGRVRFRPRLPDDTADPEEPAAEPGYLHLRTDDPWPEDPDEVAERVPEEWTEETGRGRVVRRHMRRYLPVPTSVLPDGAEAPEGVRAHWVPAPFRFCLGCGVTYSGSLRSDFGKLATLGTEGRSTATTVLSVATVKRLREDASLPEGSRKLLTFTDNRQDASLQAGHFNDFVQVGVLRSALYRAALAAGEEGIRHEDLTHRVFAALGLGFEDYALNPDARFAAREQTNRALREVLGYRLYHDLRRGWRVIAPNLEQCGLLQVDYAALGEVCRAEDLWSHAPGPLAAAPPDLRERLARTLLDYLRRGLAIRVDYLRPEYQERIRQLSSQHLKWPWALDENETLARHAVAYPRPRRPEDEGGDIFLSPRGGFARYACNELVKALGGGRIATDEAGEIVRHLLEALRIGGLVEQVRDPRGPDDVPGFQVPASALVWRAGDGTTPAYDPLRVPRRPGHGGTPNPFFVRYYRQAAEAARGLEAREHTAQVRYEDRKDREERFRQGKLPVLFCSPTMELGVDIAELNAVGLRNIPPTPANYAQRSGRAGRSGQPALVFAYCSTGSSHDQYFFKRPERMVAGQVEPPRLDLSNEDLLRAHVHAIWLAESGLDLGTSLRDLLELEGQNPSLDLLPSVRAAVEAEGPRQKARERARALLEGLAGSLRDADWYSEGWLDEVLHQIPRRFDQACDRWRGLYRAALAQRDEQDRIIRDATRTQAEKREARRLRQEAETQLQLLLEAENPIQSDFYSYRYFAGEGFLPGYNFPRLPLSAYIPGGPVRKNDEFISRPRFLAISEFGPRSIIYHEGSKYVIHKAILPVGDEDGVGSGRAKVCDACGYHHPIREGEGPDVCEACGTALGAPLVGLFRLQNVATRRRERISSDEEERIRLGYEIRTAFRFAIHGGRPSRRVAHVVTESGERLARLTYAHGATLWRINLGWKRRSDPNRLGFILDRERGYWARAEHLPADDRDDPMSPNRIRVVPYVEDHKNSLLVEPEGSWSPEQMASLQAALKSAIQLEFQLEENELGVEPLPSPKDRRVVLLYEAAEGGAGVLRRLFDDPSALGRVARKALGLCHFDPRTGQDLRRAERAREDCEAACYDCLMTYANQADHRLLDRHLVRDFLLALSHAQVVASPVEEPRAEHYEALLGRCESELERRWLRWVYESNLRLPSHAQLHIEAAGTRPDFFYEEANVAVYVDGPPHDFPDRAERDRLQTRAMEDLGLTVVRFHHEDDWAGVVGRFPYVFGKLP